MKKMQEIMLLFDLDGTLWDSAENVAKSWNEILEKRRPGYKRLTAENIHNVMGKTMDDIAKILMPDEDPVFRKNIFDECMNYENYYIGIHGGKLYEGVAETLEALQNAGFKMSIVSNCQEGYINAFLKSMDMGEFFSDIEEWGRTKLTKGENIRLVMKRNGFESGIYIGDTAGDEKAAQDAQIPFVHAAYGFGTVQTPDYVINEFRQLLTLADNWKNKFGAAH